MRKKSRILFAMTIVIMIGGMASSGWGQTLSDWKQVFEENNANGTFVLKNISTQEVFVHDGKRSEEDFVPASTFKVINSMIALQEASVHNADDTLGWDGVDRGNRLWNQDHSMRTAFPVSCVWFYQELARRTGVDKMLGWIKKTGYGNGRIGTEVDRFWLDGPLAISAMGQVGFIEKLVTNSLPFHENVQMTVKEIMLTDSTGNYKLYSKTGWAQKIGWNVGFVETKEAIWVFAMNMDMDDINKAKARISITYEVLRKEGII